MKLPNGERAVVDIAKLRDYSLSATHEEGKHKARVFAAALGVGPGQAEWLRDRLIIATREGDCQLGDFDEYGQRYVIVSMWNLVATPHHFVPPGSCVPGRISLA